MVKVGGSRRWMANVLNRSVGVVKQMCRCRCGVEGPCDDWPEIEVLLQLEVRVRQEGEVSDRLLRKEKYAIVKAAKVHIFVPSKKLEVVVRKVCWKCVSFMEHWPWYRQCYAAACPHQALR